MVLRSGEVGGCFGVVVGGSIYIRSDGVGITKVVVVMTLAIAVVVLMVVAARTRKV